MHARFAESPHILYSVDQMLRTLETCCGYGYDKECKLMCIYIFFYGGVPFVVVRNLRPGTECVDPHCFLCFLFVFWVFFVLAICSDRCMLRRQQRQKMRDRHKYMYLYMNMWICMYLCPSEGGCGCRGTVIVVVVDV